MVSTRTGHQSVKANLVKRAFAEAAKKIIIEEGIESVSVRKVADRAGYTFATLYNHFKSEDELLWYTRNIMIGDIVAYMNALKGEDAAGIHEVQKIFSRYLDYFLTYPNVFRFFYFHRLKRSEKPEGCETNIPGGDEALRAFEFLTVSGCYTADEVGTMIQTMIFCAHGLLTLSISDNDELSLREVHSRMDEVIRFLLPDPGTKKRGRKT